MEEIGLEVPRSGFAHSLRRGRGDRRRHRLPDHGAPELHPRRARARASPRTPARSRQLAAEGLAASPVGQILVEQSIAGWKEFELEVMRDGADNCVVVCSIENFDPMGVHTGDSITVAPAQTLTDVEYQAMRDDAFACLRRVGVETGGSNVQFAVDPATGRRVIIEMNPRVSRSSALASKATGFPIAKIAARLAVGYLLDEIPNDITRATPACFEPTIDYVVTKVPRWAFEKLPGRRRPAGHPHAVGGRGDGHRPHLLRVAAEGAALARAGPGRAQRRPGRGRARRARRRRAARPRIAVATPERIFEVEAALRRGVGVEEVVGAHRHRPLVRPPARRASRPSAGRHRGRRPALGPADFRRAKRLGFSDAQLAYLLRRDRGRRARRPGWPPACGRPSRPSTPARPSSRPSRRTTTPPTRRRTRSRPSDARPRRHPGSGPNRIGQGIEFDYCCVHASMALRDAGYETVMVNCNPETVSTDYDTSDRLYFEPLTAEDVANVLDAELAAGGTRGRGHRLARRPDAAQAGRLAPARSSCSGPARPPSTWPRTASAGTRCATARASPSPRGARPRPRAEALAVAGRVGYPVLLRPSYVLGGRAMEIVYDDDGVRRVMQAMTTRRAGARGRGHGRAPRAGRPLLGGRGRGRRRRRARRRPARS